MIPHPYPNWIEIDLDQFSQNLRIIRSLSPHSKYLLPVKAHAYGHGILACSLAAQKFGVDFLGIAHAFEGAPLRRGGVTLPILVLGPALPSDFELILHYRLTPTFADWQTVATFDEYLKQRNLQWPAHFKIDTGMHRYGFPLKEWETKKLKAYPNIIVEGFYSHIANGEKPSYENTLEQIELFEKTNPPKGALRHLANSGSLLHYPQAHFDMIRPGLLSYGYSPNEDGTKPEGIKECMSLHATIRQIRSLNGGEKISYGHRWEAPGPCTIAAVALGYGDGLFREAHPQSQVMIQGKTCPIVGTICMDTFLVDVTELPTACVGDRVDVLSEKASEELSIFKQTERIGTIPYEQTCHVARRLYRLYRWKGKLCRWDEIKEELGYSPTADSSYN